MAAISQATGAWEAGGNLDTLVTKTPACPTTSTPQPANTAGNVVVKNVAGRLWSVVVTATGTASLSIFDNASTNSGTVLLTIPANATVGSIYSFPGGAPAANGIVSGGVLNCPAVTIYWS